MKGMGNMGDMMKQMQKQAATMQKKMEEVQQELKERVIETSSGGGMVTVQANGKQEILNIKIDPEVVNPDDVQMLEDLVLAAVSQALKNSQEMHQEEMSKVTGGLNVPGLSNML
ncbi:MAG: YbaB/EbfC family nucleoid-associated protein [Candidatus Scalindua sp. AMX11]|nr:MAG: YbaB/EbfC family nucleoid-associated protein [Candidatus Scalindua sp.]NOG85193.1 YbaB/EbfC family nucleoid-associated protein [Planctomycetota bacterium]RZV64319.1 MAG: YbaB/EbfC family nucleoid-associated protein [Candidatus Scalindua sp. SCAELEC01]TDE63437.1 MAG: YbaB/EbfC family nucleoid-associated protein [Candidatus Scalindua sp. AMX11]GJQ57309.1 MAG: nucleoid-associated protein [Candidatus Scalindua sp.]